MKDCLFCRIVAGELPCKKVYEDDHILAFYDIHPCSPVHVLVIPKPHIATLYDGEKNYQTLLGHWMIKLGEVAKIAGLANGFRTIINTGEIGRQEVLHIHAHILGGPTPLRGGLLAEQIQ